MNNKTYECTVCDNLTSCKCVSSDDSVPVFCPVGVEPKWKEAFKQPTFEEFQKSLIDDTFNMCNKNVSEPTIDKS